MANDRHTFDEPFRTENRLPVQANRHLASEIVKTDDGANSCTIYDPRTSGVERMSTWITAIGDAFVDCREHR